MLSALAIKKVVETLHMKMEDTIAFGDSMNDYEMLQVCNYGKSIFVFSISSLLKAIKQSLWIPWSWWCVLWNGKVRIVLMFGLGTIVNTISVVAGGIIGLLFKNGLKNRYQETIMQGIGLEFCLLVFQGRWQGC